MSVRGRGEILRNFDSFDDGNEAVNFRWLVEKRGELSFMSDMWIFKV